MVILSLVQLFNHTENFRFLSSIAGQSVSRWSFLSNHSFSNRLPVQTTKGKDLVWYFVLSFKAKSKIFGIFQCIRFPRLHIAEALTERNGANKLQRVLQIYHYSKIHHCFFRFYKLRFVLDCTLCSFGSLSPSFFNIACKAELANMILFGIWLITNRCVKKVVEENDVNRSFFQVLETICCPRNSLTWLSRT